MPARPVVQVVPWRSRRRRPARRCPDQLHAFEFRLAPKGLHPRFATVLVRGTMGQAAAIGTAFSSFIALLTAAAGYRPTIRLDLMGHDGLALARAYDRWQARWGDPRRAFVTGDLPPRRARGVASRWSSRCRCAARGSSHDWK